MRALPLAVLMLGSGCATPALQSQSCVLSPACMAPAASGELLLPTAPTVLRAAQAVRWAFACVEQELGRDIADHLTREPRYGKDASTGGYVLTDEGAGTLVPDIVLHMVHDATRIQLLYDFLFPCTSRSKSDPLGPGRQVLLKKLEKYEPLASQQRRALITPQLGVSRWIASP